MVVEFNDGSRRLVWEDKLIDKCGFMPMFNISDELVNSDAMDGEHIVKVFLVHDVGSFSDFFRDRHLTCIWDRNKEKANER
jgi:hypothetical protein